jgi:hypothetical protein
MGSVGSGPIGVMETLLKYVHRYGSTVYCTIMLWLSKNQIKSLLNQSKCHGPATLYSFPCEGMHSFPCAGHIPAGSGERAGVPGGFPALPPAAGLPPSSPAAHRTGTG